MPGRGRDGRGYRQPGGRPDGAIVVTSGPASETRPETTGQPGDRAVGGRSGQVNGAPVNGRIPDGSGPGGDPGVDQDRHNGVPAAAPDAGSGAGPASDDHAATAEPEPVLPEPVRQRVVTLASAALGGLPDDQLPAGLRKIARFAPHRRAKLGGTAIAAALSADPLLRQNIAARVAKDVGELADAVLDGNRPSAADPVDVAALAYLLRPNGWIELIGRTTEAVRTETEAAAVADQLRAAERRAAQAEQERAAAKAESARLREQFGDVRAELDGLRDEVRALTRSLREAERRERKAAELLATERGRAARAATDHEAEVRRLRTKIDAVESALDVARGASREGRAIDDARLWLLLETISQAAGGLRRELALDPVDRLPADFVADAASEQPGEAPGSNARALDTNDPARLDQLLAMPKVHLIVDGYNVTKSGYGELSLEQQRQRLSRTLSGLAAQTGSEVTLVFDGAERIHGAATPPRGVRVLFSKKGETADDLIRRLVRAEPPGRPVVVISSDREVADGVARHGAYPLGALALLRRLARA